MLLLYRIEGYKKNNCRQKDSIFTTAYSNFFRNLHRHKRTNERTNKQTNACRPIFPINSSPPSIDFARPKADPTFSSIFLLDFSIPRTRNETLENASLYTREPATSRGISIHEREKEREREESEWMPPESEPEDVMGDHVAVAK